MADFTVLHTYFEKLNKRQLSDREKEEISTAFKKQSCKKKQVLVHAGDANSRHYYIEKGLLRLYVIDPNGKEFNILFAKEKQWLGDLATPAPTPYYIDALENTTVFSIEESGFQKIIGYYMDLATNIRRSYVFLQKRFVSILSKTAEENYEELVQLNPDLIQRLPQYHISSYLGVTPVFLSKILAKRARKG